MTFQFPDDPRPHETPTSSLLRMLMIILHSLARLLLQTLNIMLHIRNLLPIRFNLIHSPKPRQHLYPMTHLSSQISNCNTKREETIIPQTPNYCSAPPSNALSPLSAYSIGHLYGGRSSLCAPRHLGLSSHQSNQISNSFLPSTLHSPTQKRKNRAADAAKKEKRRNKDERSLWSDSLSAARAVLMWKGRRGVVVVVGRRRRSGDALVRRASLVRRVIAGSMLGVYYGLRMEWNGMGWVTVECVLWLSKKRRDISATSF